MTSTRAVLFDIDGTLVDSNYLHVEAWSRALHEVGASVDAWRIHRGIGMDSDLLLRDLLGDDADALAERASDLNSRYYQELTDRLRPFEGARELLARLDSQGITVVLATSAPEDELEILRGVLDVEDSIASVTSAADVETAKPAPDIVEVALTKAKTDAAATVMVGDSVWDIQAAGRAGVAAVGVLSGGVSRAELMDAGAVAVYADVADLLEHLEGSPLLG